jgi:hypothetical protein
VVAMRSSARHSSSRSSIVKAFRGLGGPVEALRLRNDPPHAVDVLAELRARS